MMNDPFAHEQADKFAVRIGLAQTDVSRRIDSAYWLALGRGASATRLEPWRNYLRECRGNLQETKCRRNSDPRSAGQLLSRVISAVTNFSLSNDMRSSNVGFTRRQMIRSLVSGSIFLPGIFSQLLADEFAATTTKVRLRPDCRIFQAKPSASFFST